MCAVQFPSRLITVSHRQTYDRSFGRVALVSSKWGAQPRPLALGFAATSRVVAGAAERIPGGQFVVAGCAQRDKTVFVAAFDSNGDPVTAFGANGVTRLSQLDNACVSSVIVQDAAMLLVGTGLGPTGNNTQMFTARVFFNGTVDATWGSGLIPGVQFIRTSPFGHEGTCGLFQAAGGETLLVGTYLRGDGNSSRVLVARLSSTGSVVEFAYHRFSNTTSSRATACLRHPLNGALVVVGLGGSLLSAMRFVPGSITTLDPSFGLDGVAATDMVSSHSTERACVAATLPDGALVLVGVVGAQYPFGVASARMLRDGTLDASWNRTAIDFQTRFEAPEVNAIQVLPSGDVLLAGRALMPAATSVSFLIGAAPQSTSCAAGPQCLCIGQVCATQGNYVAPSVSAVTTVILGTVLVNGNIVSSVNGNLVIRPPPYGDGVVFVSGGVYANSGQVLVQVNGSGTYALITSSGGFQGDFRFVFDASAAGECQGAIASQQSLQGGTLSVTVTIGRTCLKRAEIAGISLSIVAVSCVGVLLLMLFFRFRRARQDAAGNVELREKAYNDIKLEAAKQLKPNSAYQGEFDQGSPESSPPKNMPLIAQTL